MAVDRRALDRLRAQARQARADGHFAQAARLERQAVELAGALGLVGERTRALLWEGYSQRQAGEDDLALAVLLQAANERAASADPADVFGALVAIVHISLERKTAAFCRTLLEQGRRYLVDIRRPWTALLDFLEGELACRRGDFAAAWGSHSRAWANWRDEPPRLTAATHIWALCRVAFRRRDLAELERLTETLNALCSAQALERQLAQRVRLLLWRARRAADLAGADSESAPVAIARILVAETTDGKSRDFGSRHEALRALALMGRWEEIDVALSRQPLQADSFENALLLADLALSRARTVLGLPMVDDDYGEWGADFSAPISSPGMLALREAKHQYQAASTLAEVQNQRLETKWYSNTVQNRLGVSFGR